MDCHPSSIRISLFVRICPICYDLIKYCINISLRRADFFSLYKTFTMAGDPFLSDPSRKRKRNNRTSSTTRKISRDDRSKAAPAVEEDEEISGSETGDEIQDASDREMSSDEEFEHENAADKRRRLAKQYLENLKTTDVDDDFNAKDLDDDIITRRLQRDVAENKGQVFKFYGKMLQSQAEDLQTAVTRIGSKNLTSLAIHYPNLYTVSKDMEIIKWNIQNKRKPERVKHTKGGNKYVELHSEKNHHCDAINCVAASPDGKFLVTGGQDGRLIIWSTENLASLKVLEARSPINSIAFRRNTDQLYAACADLKVRTYSINQFSQLEILYGHQDNISDISALSRETCVSVGSRDRTALFWKIADESRLTFRGGDGEKSRKSSTAFHEGSIDTVSMVDESHFVTGSDNGNISLWSLAKKKPVYTERVAHGLEPEIPSFKASAETTTNTIDIPARKPYWITSVYAIPFTDIFVSGSYSGEIKLWKIDDNLRSFENIGTIQAKGVVNKIEAVEVADKKKITIYALVSKEHKFGRWLGKIEGRNSLVSFAFNI